MIQINNLTFQYPTKEHVFKFPNIHLKEQENLLVLGKSGVGKTTLLHILAGLLQPTQGTVKIDDVSIHSLSHQKLDAFRGQNIGLVFQSNHAVNSLTVLENLQARLFFSKQPVDPKKIDVLLEELGLIQLKKHYINELSQGQLQRLAIALSVIHNPKIILADEPTSSLDDDNCKVVIELLKKKAEQTNANLVVITHDQRVKSLFSNTLTL
ncbi:putative ABC transport system ATP-binding protein [Wenyingzhuangia heitensis]|uniref:ABC transport system ATP-binding protein n=1 Tax=Wenyingzhuangia heitensis TaxID=1487859 RepID=A0ABX0UFA0_9FLAO|nr:ATP-binding cassette domain-containing protein [Wenyingzhuangia heitensis]NIJ46555.1 putative ABC transport system ATP-binding protein [Wenyingzhuangia heitensis]